MNQPTARDEVLGIAKRFKLPLSHSPEAEAEAAALLSDPGLDDPALEDTRHLPFVTIDNEDSRDLDQALYIEATSDGFRVFYALADAAWYVRPGSALYRESLERGTSFYLPGLVVPMLPKSLSEGLVSLNPKVDRRALTFIVELDAAGEIRHTEVRRQRIHSQAKLSYAGVQSFWDLVTFGERTASEDTHHPLAAQPYTTSLLLLREVGRLRTALAEIRGVVHYARIEVDLGFTDEAGRSFIAFESRRYETDRANEQISLLVNVEGARLLEHYSSEAHPEITAIYRVHPAPTEDQLEALEASSQALVHAHGLSSELAWSRKHESLAEWISRMQRRLGRHPVALAMQRQALLINQRSSFSKAPGLHFGVGAPSYARFTSPMREVVGIHSHRELLEAMGLQAPDPRGDESTAQVIKAANRAKDRQHQLTKAANQVAIDAFLRPDLTRPESQRRWLWGTVLGLGSDKAYVLLDNPPLELKIYARDLGDQWELSDPNTLTISGAERGYALRLGDRVALIVKGIDEARDRFQLGLADLQA